MLKRLRASRLLKAVFGGALLAALAITTVTPPAPAQAAPVVGFEAGRIISDNLFYDGNAMSSAEIQTFLDRNIRGGKCTLGQPGRKPGDPARWGGEWTVFANACLNGFRQTTQSRPANQYCAAYAGRANESSADIIAKVARACSISPKVLLVMLEKEQSLVSDEWTNQLQYDRAMGYACPDSGPNNTANCDSSQSGFYQQVYRAAWQLQVYKAFPNNYSYRPFQNNTIQWNPDPKCGTSRVYIENYATAALYIYTPYRPNQAALNAGTGTGDACSSYGNRNFYVLYTSWFGSTQDGGVTAPPLTAIAQKYQSLGGARGTLGAATGGEVCGLKDQGCYQMFQNGAITWTPRVGAWATWGDIRARWQATGFEGGALGYPTGDQVCGIQDQGCYQMFQNGAITWTKAAGAWETAGVFRAAWARNDYERGSLKFPVGPVVTGLSQGASYQMFQGGAVLSHPTAGTWSTFGPIRDAWARTGYERGTLGYPTGDQVCGMQDQGCYQLFQKGAITWTAKAGAWETTGAFRAAWARNDYERGSLKYPVGTVVTGLPRGGSYQMFQGGAVLSHPTAGTWSTFGPIRDAWGRTGYERGTLGYPTGDQVCGLREQGCYQMFENGAITWTPGVGAWETSGPIRKLWADTRFESGVLGFPIAAPQTTATATVQRFQRGVIAYYPATNSTFASWGGIHTAWLETGGLKSPLGFPTSSEIPLPNGSGVKQTFERGEIQWVAGKTTVTYAAAPRSAAVAPLNDSAAPQDEAVAPQSGSTSPQSGSAPQADSASPRTLQMPRTEESNQGDAAN